MGLIDIGLPQRKNKVNSNSKARIEGKNTIKGGIVQCSSWMLITECELTNAQAI